VAETSFRCSALESVYQQGSFGADRPNGPGLTLHERRPLSIVHIGTDADGSVHPSLGCALPSTPNTTSQSDNHRILWLAPKRWLVVSNDEIHGELEKRATAAFKNAAITDVSNGRTVIRLQGPDIRTVLSKGCPVDLHPSVFSSGNCVQSRIGSLNVLIDCIDGNVIDVYIARGFGQVLWEWLTEASAEFGYQVGNPGPD